MAALAALWATSLYAGEVGYSVQAEFRWLPVAREAYAALSVLPPSIPYPGDLIAPTDDPLVSQDWALERIGALKLRALREDQAADVVVAIVDTGADYTHEDLSLALWRKSDSVREIGYDFAEDRPEPYDFVKWDLPGCQRDFNCRVGIEPKRYLVNPGHGTHVAGLVGAVARNGAGSRGAGAGARLMILKAFHDPDSAKPGEGDEAAAVKSIDYAIANGARVINLSWGQKRPRADAAKSPLKAALRRARDAGVLVVVAAGNGSLDLESAQEPVYPAAYAPELDNLVVVAASDKTDALASFSNFGATNVHLAAPGTRMLSTVPGDAYSDVISRTTDAQGLQVEMEWQGTSMAAPLVSGAAAQLLRRHPELDYREVKRRLIAGVRQVPELQGKVFSGGVLDVSRVVK